MKPLRKALSKYRNEDILSVIKHSISYLSGNYLNKSLNDIYYAILMYDTYDIYAESWDLLIILDGCRYDIMQSLASDYDFIDTIDSRYSPASASKEWLQYQFYWEKYSEQMRQTTYLTANPFTKQVLNKSNFKLLDEVWRYAWSQELGTVPPRAVTDRTIAVSRKRNPDHVVAHYMQPHFPSVKYPELGGKVNPEQNIWINSVWSSLREGELDHEAVYNGYKSNLTVVLREIELLLANTDFEDVVITADHGNGFGEEGIYGHPNERIHPCLRKVPWITTSASDTNKHSPDSYNRDSDDISINDRLSALGYIN